MPSKAAQADPVVPLVVTDASTSAQSAASSSGSSPAPSYLSDDRLIAMLKKAHQKGKLQKAGTFLKDKAGTVLSMYGAAVPIDIGTRLGDLMLQAMS